MSSQAYNADQTDFRPYLTQIAAQHVDGIYMPGYYKDGAAILKQARELGLVTHFLGSTTHEDPQLLAIAGNASEGFLYPFSTGYDAASRDPVVVAFNRKFFDRYHRQPGLVAALGYDCTTLLIAAVEHGGSTPEAIRKYLAGVRQFHGASGTFGFDANGDVQKPILLKTVRAGRFMTVDTR